MHVFSFFAPKQGNNLPVMVWLHGGSYVYGSSSAPGLDGSVFASTNQAVVVTLQYRLGMLGLLRADDAGVGGNMAVRDVILALSASRLLISEVKNDDSQASSSRSSARSVATPKQSRWPVRALAPT